MDENFVHSSLVPEEVETEIIPVDTVANLLAVIDDDSYQKAKLEDSYRVLQHIVLPMCFPWGHPDVSFQLIKNIPKDIDEMPALYQIDSNNDEDSHMDHSSSSNSNSSNDDKNQKMQTLSSSGLSDEKARQSLGNGKEGNGSISFAPSPIKFGKEGFTILGASASSTTDPGTIKLTLYKPATTDLPNDMQGKTESKRTLSQTSSSSSALVQTKRSPPASTRVATRMGTRRTSRKRKAPADFVQDHGQQSRAVASFGNGPIDEKERNEKNGQANTDVDSMSIFETYSKRIKAEAQKRLDTDDIPTERRMVSVRFGGVSSRSSIFGRAATSNEATPNGSNKNGDEPPSRLPRPHANSKTKPTPKRNRQGKESGRNGAVGTGDSTGKARRPVLLSAFLPQDIQTGRSCIYDAAIENGKVLGTFDIRHPTTVYERDHPEEGPAMNKCKRINTGRGRLLWTTIHLGKVPDGAANTAAAVRGRVYYTSSITGQRMEPGSFKRPREVVVGIRVNGSLIQSEESSNPLKSLQSVRNYAVGATTSDGTELAGGLSGIPERTFNEIVDELTVFDRLDKSGGYCNLDDETGNADGSANRKPGSHTDNHSVVPKYSPMCAMVPLSFRQRLLKDRRAQRKEETSIETVVPSTDAPDNLQFSKAIVAMRNQPQYDCIPLLDGRVRTVCTVAGNLKPCWLPAIFADDTDDTDNKNESENKNNPDEGAHDGIDQETTTTAAAAIVENGTPDDTNTARLRNSQFHDSDRLEETDRPSEVQISNDSSPHSASSSKPAPNSTPTLPTDLSSATADPCSRQSDPGERDSAATGSGRRRKTRVPARFRTNEDETDDEDDGLETYEDKKQDPVEDNTERSENTNENTNIQSDGSSSPVGHPQPNHDKTPLDDRDAAEDAHSTTISEAERNCFPETQSDGTTEQTETRTNTKPNADTTEWTSTATITTGGDPSVRPNPSELKGDEQKCCFCPHLGGPLEYLDHPSFPRHTLVHDLCRLFILNRSVRSPPPPVVSGNPFLEGPCSACAICGLSGDSTSTAFPGFDPLVPCAASGCGVLVHPMCARVVTTVSSVLLNDAFKGAHSKSPIDNAMDVDAARCEQYTITTVRVGNKTKKSSQSRLIPIVFCGLHNPHREASFYGCYPSGDVFSSTLVVPSVKQSKSTDEGGVE